MKYARRVPTFKWQF